MSTIRKRADQKLQNTWALEDMFPSVDAWEDAYKEVLSLSNEVAAYKGTLSQSPDQLAKVLKAYDDLGETMEKVIVYAHMRSHEDMGNNFNQGLADRATTLSIQVAGKVSFIEPEILAMNNDQLTSFLADDVLSFYKKDLERLIRLKEHILPEEQEKLLSQAREISAGPQKIFSVLNDADFKFPSIQDGEGKILPVSHGSFINLLTNSDRQIRQEAYKSYYGTYLSHRNSLGSIYGASVKGDIFFATAKKYDDSLDAALKPNNISKDVYKNLIKAVHNNVDTMHRYVALRKSTLGLEELHPYDLYVSIVKEEKPDVISFEEAKETVLKAMAPLGEDYVKTLEVGFNNRWIDIYENEGKRSGAYSWGAYGTHPYVFLNYADSMKNMFTLAHEMGHALHTYYSDETQAYRYAQYPIFLAEVASTVNEALLMHYLLENTEDPGQRQVLLNYYMEQFRSTLYRQTLFAEFELEVHERMEQGQALQTDDLCGIYRELIEKYYGKELLIDDALEIEWARIPHFYRAFYVYQYATGFSAAIAISKRIIEEGQPAVDDYFKFLKGGISDDPLHILNWAGVDMTTPEPVENALRVFAETVTEMENLLGK